MATVIQTYPEDIELKCSLLLFDDLRVTCASIVFHQESYLTISGECEHEAAINPFECTIEYEDIVKIVLSQSNSNDKRYMFLEFEPQFNYLLDDTVTMMKSPNILSLVKPSNISLSMDLRRFLQSQIITGKIGTITYGEAKGNLLIIIY